MVKHVTTCWKVFHAHSYNCGLCGTRMSHVAEHPPIRTSTTMCLPELPPSPLLFHLGSSSFKGLVIPHTRRRGRCRSKCAH